MKNKYSRWGGQNTYKLNPNKKKVLSIVFLSLFSIALVSFGTYAIWNSELLTGNNTISSGEVKMSYTETNEISISNALPIKDEEGKVSTNYFDFQVLSYIKTNKNDSTLRKLKYNIVLEPIKLSTTNKETNEILVEYDSSSDKFEGAASYFGSFFKVYLTKVVDGKEEEVTGPINIADLADLNDYILKSQEEVFKNGKDSVITYYRLRIWMDEDVDPSEEGFDYHAVSYKFRVNVNGGAGGVSPNAPELTSNMIPVYYDSSNDVWKKADATNSDESNKWYDYDSKIWANAVTVTSTNRQTYLNASAGTEISMDDINTMWVWIPRYTYTYLNTNTPQKIQIKFESGTNSSGTIKCSDAINQTDSDGNTISEVCADSTNGTLIAGTSTYTHPAFWWDKNDDSIRTEDEELTGIWVGKFEVSSDTTCSPLYNTAVGEGCNLQTIRPLIKPNVTSWSGAQVGTFFNGIYNMRETGNQYGFSTTDETHMMKNMEWGAVVYLSHSKYGINKEIATNSKNSHLTGYGPHSEDSSDNAYNTILGQSASTTGNVYGVYDMSGGADEYVMGNEVYSDGQQMIGNSTSNNWNSSFTGVLANGTSFTGTYSFPSKKYYDKYSYGTSQTEYTRGKLGDATKEMAPTVGYNIYSWYLDGAYFPDSSSSWFARGSNAGAFGFNGYYGYADSYYSSRAVVSNLK